MQNSQDNICNGVPFLKLYATASEIPSVEFLNLKKSQHDEDNNPLNSNVMQLCKQDSENQNY